MKKRFLMIIGLLLLIGTAQLSAQVEFIDQMSLGFNYGFAEELDDSGPNFKLEYLMGAHIHSWDMAILAGIRYDFVNFDVGGQVEYFFGYNTSRNLTGFGALLGGGVQIETTEVIPYIKTGGFWHMATMLKVSLELDYRFNGQFSAGLMVSIPSATILFRIDEFQKNMEDRGQANNQGNNISITIANDTGYEVHYVYISPSNVDSWGSDKLDSNEVLRSGAFRRFSLPPLDVTRTYDIMIVDLDGDSYTKFDVTISPNMIVRFIFDDID